ncbi:alpha/beta fold hydrolase [Actinoplanes friuliensis]|uniref:Hydrolase n=1 Tax=Actinoplanes friuliensis DSM 7358 TaxID=1246995 RepID=U5VX20_9ACTN|nr:alpha/beta fold hydrolase [Actinoplanes friuliensis]AGZ41337.1 hydrolase [Actinoplanes friuliensis DSM 7358]
MELRRIRANGTELNVALDGAGPPVLLVHGWPHTWQVWQLVLPLLAGRRRVIAPDLRGLGDSARAAGGFDAATGAGDLTGLLDALGVDRADVVALDAGVPAAFLLGALHPDRVRRLVLMEATLPGLPGGFPAPPWWFGFHAVPGLAETVLQGHEGTYVDHFLRTGTYEQRGVPPEIREAFVRSYTGREALRCGFGYYRAAEQNAAAIVAAGRLTVPTVAVGGNTVGDLLHRQLVPVADRLSSELVPRSGHLVPLDRPDAVAGLLLGE